MFGARASLPGDKVPLVGSVNTGSKPLDTALSGPLAVWNVFATAVNMPFNAAAATEIGYNAATKAVLGQEGFSGEGLSRDVELAGLYAMQNPAAGKAAGAALRFITGSGLSTGAEASAGGAVLGPEGPGQFAMKGDGPLHSTVAIRQDSLVNRVFDSGFASNPKAAQPLGRYFGEGGTLPPTAAGATEQYGLNLPGIVNDARMGAVYKANANIPALRGPAAGGTGTELKIDPSYFGNLKLQGGLSKLP